MTPSGFWQAAPLSCRIKDRLTFPEVTAVSHISVYRRWRPQTFEEVIGQERITHTLQNAIRAGRITHAYLFAGHRGTGKTTVARILAKALNCAQGPTPNPDNTCPVCLGINQGSSLDVIEIDGASHTQVDHIRDLKEKIVLVPAEGRYKVYIIDEVHMLSTSAFNALLKTLEEPPPHALFALGDALLRRDPVEVLRIASGLIDEGKESRQIMRTLLEHFRDLLIAKVAQNPEGVLDSTPERLAALQRQAAGAELTDILRAVKILSDADVEARSHSQPRLLLELFLIRLARPEMDPTIEGLQARGPAVGGGGEASRGP